MDAAGLLDATMDDDDDPTTPNVTRRKAYSTLFTLSRGYLYTVGATNQELGDAKGVWAANHEPAGNHRLQPARWPIAVCAALDGLRSLADCSEFGPLRGAELDCPRALRRQNCRRDDRGNYCSRNPGDVGACAQSNTRALRSN